MTIQITGMTVKAFLSLNCQGAVNFDTELLIIYIPCFGAKQNVFLHGMGSCSILPVLFL